MPPQNSPQAPLRGPGLLERLVSAFAVRDFRWLWAYNAIAALSMTMEMLAEGWLVLTLTDSPFWVGAVAGLRGAGLVGFGALGGVIADRVNRRNALLMSQQLRALALLVLGLLIVSDHIELWQVLAVALLQGMFQAIALPANNALIYDTVGRSLLLNAMAARLAAFNLTRILGSLLAGAVISILGVGACYLLVASILLTGPWILLFLHTSRPASHAREPVWRNLVEGLSYVARTGSLRSLLMFSLLMEMFGFSHFVMLPVMARDVLQVGATGLGYLSAAGGVGALAGTLAVASLGDFKAKGAMLALTSGGAGLCLLLFALSPWFAVSLILLALVGGTIMAYDATMATLLQLLTTDAMRSRILGLYGLTFGFTPLGGFIAGVVATVLSAPFAIGMGGAIITSYVVGSLRPKGRLQESIGPSTARTEEIAKRG